MTNEEAEQRGFAASEDMDADMTPTPQAEEPGARQAGEYASKHWSGDDYTAAFDSYIAGYQAALRVALPQPEVAPDDEALLKQFGDTLYRFRKEPSSQNYDEMRAADEALRRHIAGLRYEADVWRSKAETRGREGAEARAALAACRDKTIEEACDALKAKQAMLIDVGCDGPVVNAFLSAIGFIRALKDKEPTNG